MVSSYAGSETFGTTWPGSLTTSDLAPASCTTGGHLAATSEVALLDFHGSFEPSAASSEDFEMFVWVSVQGAPPVPLVTDPSFDSLSEKGGHAHLVTALNLVSGTSYTFSLKFRTTSSTAVAQGSTPARCAGTVLYLKT
jgi:hypothetical protein